MLFFEREPDFHHSGLRVEFSEPLPNWHDLIKALKPDEIADAIASHFLPYFLYKWLPEITIQFGEHKPESVNAHFRDIFVQSESGEISCDIDGVNERLSYSLAKIGKTRSFKSHCLLFSAADRIVGSPRDLTNKLGQPHFTNEADESYVVIAVVRGEAFESRLNDARTGINLSPKSVEAIVSAVSDVIQRTEKAQIDKIKNEQSVELNSARGRIRFCGWA